MAYFWRRYGLISRVCDLAYVIWRPRRPPHFSQKLNAYSSFPRKAGIQVGDAPAAARLKSDTQTLGLTLVEHVGQRLPLPDYSHALFQSPRGWLTAFVRAP
jgi:hypothetical protein